MQLLNMEVDRFGARGHLHLGRFSPGLNAIYGPPDSGREQLLQWLRHVTAESQPHEQQGVEFPTLDGQSIRGEVHWMNRGLSFRLADGHDGRISYARTDNRHGDPFHPTREYFSAAQRLAFRGLADANGLRDTEAELVALAQRLHLHRSDVPQSTVHRERLVAREQELVRLLEATPRASDRGSLIRRRDELQLMLQRWSTLPHSELASDHRRLGQRFEVIEAELHNRLREIEQLDREIVRVREQLAKADATEDHRHAPEIGESYRRQLQQLDDRLNRWRQTLRDLKAHRERVEHNSTDVRLDQQIGDQLSVSKQADPRAPLRSLEAQILNARRQLDSLVERYGVEPIVMHDPSRPAFDSPLRPTIDSVRREIDGRTTVTYLDQAPSIGVHALPDTLRSMQKDLHEVCQQLARHEATAAAETLRQQSLQLQRCEAELLQAVEKLIEERAALLRKIAAEHHLSVEQLAMAFGSWCQCHDHVSVQDWLLQEDVLHGNDHPATESRESLLAELRRLEGERSQASVRCDECRRQLRECDLHRDHYRTPRVDLQDEHADQRRRELIRELEAVQADLSAIERADQLTAELARVRDELARIPAESGRSEFRETTHRHIIGLIGNDYRRLSPRYQGSYIDLSKDLDRGNRPNGYGTQHWTTEHWTTEPWPSEYDVPPALVRLAMRLAIVEGLTARGEPIVLFADGCLDGMPHQLQQTAVGYLVSRTAAGQQIVLLTGDQHVAEVVQRRGGYVGYLPERVQRQVEPVARDSWDINRQLAAFANEEEAIKWSQPVPAATVVRSEYYLTERSAIEELPSIEPTAAARCRALGVDRIGDLLDVDPHWLADNLRLPELYAASVMDWQAEARLLCSVRNLRPFDARVLIGADIRSPKQLSEMHPGHLLERVERFLATERGRSILRSGTRYELSRITAWIAAAKSNAPRYHRSSVVDEVVYNDRNERGNTRVYSPRSTDVPVYDDYDSRGDFEHRSAAAVYEGGRTNRSERTRQHSGPASEQDATRRSSRASGDRNRRTSKKSSVRSERPRVAREESTRSAVRLAGSNREAIRLRFYLELESPVVDAPSIGPRMAERLHRVGISTVAELLSAHAESIADQLNNRRVTAAVVHQWQDQARLVCRIPNLRGHDAQLLVLCDLTSPEGLAAMDPMTVLHQVQAVAASSEGERILRGSAAPDLEEVQSWIAWAKHCRTLNAA